MDEATAAAFADIYRALERIDVILTEITKPDRVVANDQQLADRLIELRSAVHDLGSRDTRIRSGS